MNNLKNSFSAIFLLSLVLQGCIMNSTLHLTKNKKSVIITNPGLKTQDSLSISSILGSPMSWNAFVNNTSTSGRYSIHLINYTTQQFVEGRFVRTDKDFTYLDVLVSDFNKKELGHYEISYPTGALRVALHGMHNQSYRISVKANSASGWHNDLFVTKAANFEIEKDLLHLYSGEIISESGVRGKFLITNDPVDPVPVEASVWYLLLARNEQFDCPEKLKQECKERGLKLKADTARYVGRVPDSSILLPTFKCTGICIEK